MAAPPAAAEHYRSQQRIIEDSALLLEQVWGKVDFQNLTGSWLEVSDLALMAVAAGQEASASLADPYLDATAGGTVEGAVQASAFSGVASNGSDLDSLLYKPVIETKTALAGGATQRQAMARGLFGLLRIGSTQVANAGRLADGVGIAARPQVTHWVRVLRGTSCGRCTVLAGRVFTWKADFHRHPGCDCTALPVTRRPRQPTVNPDAAVRAGHVTGLSEADTKAIVQDGADASQVINAQAGMYTAGGRKLTRQGTTKRALAGQRLQGAARMRPEQIYRDATSRAQAIALLHKHGYLI